MSFVFVVDQDRTPLDPVHPGRARFLLHAGHAAVLRRYPFTIIMKDPKPDAASRSLRVKLDPGSKTTGIAVINDTTGQVVWAAEVVHRGDQVKANLDARRAQRHGRRSRHTRYRPARFNNRTRLMGGLRTGDMVRAVVPASSTKAGVYVGRIAIRATGSCNLKTAQGTIQGIHIRYCRPLHRGDGYAYTNRRSA
jgi:hypothetical protein